MRPRTCLSSADAQETPRVWVGVCTLCEGCILAAGHKGKHKVAQMEEEEYEVEAIAAERPGRSGAACMPWPHPCSKHPHTLGHVAGPEFLIKWKGWPAEDSTWESEAALVDCPKVLQSWRASAAGAATPPDVSTRPAPSQKKAAKPKADAADAYPVGAAAAAAASASKAPAATGATAARGKSLDHQRRRNERPEIRLVDAAQIRVDPATEEAPPHRETVGRSLQ